MEIGPAHLISASYRVLVGHSPPAKWPAPRAGALNHPSPPSSESPPPTDRHRVHGTAAAPVSTAPSIALPHVRPRSLSPLSPPLSKPSSLAPPHCVSPFRCRHPHFPVHRGLMASCRAASATGCGPRAPSLPREWPHPRVKLHHHDVPLKHRSCICRRPHHRASPSAFLQPSCHHHEVPSTHRLSTARQQPPSTFGPCCHRRACPPDSRCRGQPDSSEHSPF
jgi:hypothetical protein